MPSIKNKIALVFLYIYQRCFMCNEHINFVYKKWMAFYFCNHCIIILPGLEFQTYSKIQ